MVPYMDEQWTDCGPEAMQLQKLELPHGPFKCLHLSQFLFFKKTDLAIIIWEIISHKLMKYKNSLPIDAVPNVGII